MLKKLCNLGLIGLAAAMTCALPLSTVGAQQLSDTDRYCQNPDSVAYATVCTNDILYWRDNAMNDVYATLRASLGTADRNALRQSQRHWIKFRNSCGSDVSCLLTAYDDRLFVLEAQVIDGQGQPELRNPATGWAPCELLGQIIDPGDGADVSLVVQNDTDSFRVLLSVDEAGNILEEGVIEAGQRVLIDAYVGQPWFASDGPGNCLEMFFPRADLLRYNLTVPDAYFGPE